jgi:hypothetical protein
MKDNSFFFEFNQAYQSLKQGLGKRFWRLLGLIFLIALPIALVNGYSSGKLAESIFSVLPEIDFSSQTSIEILLDAFANSSQGSIAEFLLSVIISLLQCTVYIIASVYTWQCISGKTNIIDDSTAFVKHIFKKVLVVFLITYLASYVISYTLSMTAMTTSVFLAIPVMALAIAMAAISLFVIVSVVTALVDSYSSVFIASTVIGRIRFMYSMLYTRLLYKGYFFKTVVYYTLINMVTGFISLVPYAVAVYLSSIGNAGAYIAWGIASCLQCMLSGAVMCFYTSHMLQLEQKNGDSLRPFSFVNMEDEDTDGQSDQYM